MQEQRRPMAGTADSALLAALGLDRARPPGPPGSPSTASAQGCGASPRRARFCPASFWKTLRSSRLRWLSRMKGGARAGRSWYSTMRW